MLEPLRRELSGKSVILLAVEVAESLGDPSLLPLLIQFRDGLGEADDSFRKVLAGAILFLEEE